MAIGELYVVASHESEAAPVFEPPHARFARSRRARSVTPSTGFRKWPEATRGHQSVSHSTHAKIHAKGNRSLVRRAREPVERSVFARIWRFAVGSGSICFARRVQRRRCRCRFALAPPILGFVERRVKESILGLDAIPNATTS